MVKSFDLDGFYKSFIEKGSKGKDFHKIYFFLIKELWDGSFYESYGLFHKCERDF